MALLDTEEVEEDWKATMAEGATSAARRIVDNMDCIVKESVQVLFFNKLATSIKTSHPHFSLGRTEVHAQDLRGRRTRGGRARRGMMILATREPELEKEFRSCY